MERNIENSEKDDKSESSDNVIDDCNVSLDSIVSINYDNLNSGNEAPEDFTYLKEKIIKNYVTKTILLPGVDYERPSKNDYIDYEMYCFFQEENTSILKKYKSLFFDKEIETEIIDIKSNNFFYKTNGSIKEFLHIDKRLHIPEGVKQSIFRMREKEISYVLCNQKYTYYSKENVKDVKRTKKRVDYDLLEDHLYLKENYNFNNDNSKITINPHFLINDDNNEMKINKEAFEEQFFKKKLFYVFKLNHFTQYYDILSNNSLMKFIINKGKGLILPSENDIVDITINLRVDNNISDSKVFNNLQISNLINEEERRMIASMKEKEKSNFEVSPFLADLLYNNTNGLHDNNHISILHILLNKHLQQNNINETKIDIEYFSNKRIFFIVELIKLTECKYKKEMFNDNIVYKATINEGLGNICPWDNYYAWLLIKIQKVKEQDAFILNDNEENKEKNMKINNEKETIYTNYDTEFFNIERINEMKNELININIGSSFANLQIQAYKLVMNNFNQYLAKKTNSSNQRIVNTNSYDINFKDSENNEQFTKLINYDSYSLLLPNEITSFIRTMKIFESIELQISGKLDYLKINNDIEVIDNNQEKECTYFLEISLVNFTENKFIYDSEYSEKEVIEQLEKYRSLSVYYNKNNLQYKSKIILDTIIRETVNLENLIKQRVITSINVKNSPLIQDALSKTHRNYIRMLFQDKEFKECLISIQFFNEEYDKLIVLNDSLYSIFPSLIKNTKKGLSDKYIGDLHTIKELNLTYISVSMFKILSEKELLNYNIALENAESFLEEIKLHYNKIINVYDESDDSKDINNDNRLLLKEKIKACLKNKEEVEAFCKNQISSINELISTSAHKKKSMIKKMFQFNN